jgi:hypothetical protein
MHQSGSRTQEKRDVCNPNYTTEWLLNVIAGDMPLLTDHALLHKKASTIALHYITWLIMLNCVLLVSVHTNVLFINNNITHRNRSNIFIGVIAILSHNNSCIAVS